MTSAFPNLSAEQLTEFIPNKEELNVIKIYSHKGEAVTVYMNNRNPILFEIEKALYPTVYTLWVYPDLLPAFSTWPPVLQKLAGGADLMLPGVVVPSSGFPQVERGMLCAVTLLGNRSVQLPVPVIRVTFVHWSVGFKAVNRKLCYAFSSFYREYGDKSYPPTLAPLVTDPAEKESAEDEEEMEGKEPVISFSTDPLQHVDVGDLSLKERDSCAMLTGKEDLNESRAAETAEGADTEVQQEAEDSRTPQEQMDALFNQCFFHALKCKVKKSDLPLLTSTFLRSHMFSCWYVVRRLSLDLCAGAGFLSLKLWRLSVIFRMKFLTQK
uniref:Eukaryotic translation initiation factor 2D n=1 Tax=Strix occidentalis caurina TaxID=311401 RepID=A0A8D0F6R3_STROC